MYNYNIDKIKLFAAVSVVLIHVFAFIDSAYNTPLAELQMPRAFFNFAVPLFFAISGYILANKECGYIQNQCKSILRLYICFSIFYYLWAYVSAMIEASIYREEIMQALIEVFHSRNYMSLLNGTIGSYHLWYLWAMFLALHVLEVLTRWIKNSFHILLVSFAFYLLSMVLMEQGIWVNLFQYGGLPKGLFFICLGYYIGDSQRHEYRPGLMLFTAMLTYMLTFSYFYRGKFVELFLMGPIYLLVSFLNTYQGSPSRVAKLGAYSDQIYLLHVLGIQLYNIAMRLHPALMIHNLFVRVVAITSFAILVSLLFYPGVQAYFIEPIDSWLRSWTERKFPSKSDCI